MRVGIHNACIPKNSVLLVQSFQLIDGTCDRQTERQNCNSTYVALVAQCVILQQKMHLSRKKNVNSVVPSLQEPP